MPINHVAPAAAPPADRLNLSATMLRSVEPNVAQLGACIAPYCFADEDATPSA